MISPKIPPKTGTKKLVMAGPEITIKQEREQNSCSWNYPPTPLPAMTYTPYDDLY
jgi:hypothetical protein